MNLKNPVVAIIAVSLICAAAIVVASALLQGRESADTVTWILVAIWWVPFSLLMARAAKNVRNE